MRNAILVLILSTLLTACWQPDTHNTVLIDPAFSPEEVEQLLAGLDMWTEVSDGEFTFDVRVSDDRAMHAIALRRETPKGIAQGLAHTRPWGCPVDLAPGRVKGTTLAKVAAHEVGHCLGLHDWHSSDPHDLMNLYSQGELTLSDVERVRAAQR